MAEGKKTTKTQAATPSAGESTSGKEKAGDSLGNSSTVNPSAANIDSLTSVASVSTSNTEKVGDRVENPSVTNVAAQTTAPKTLPQATNALDNPVATTTTDVKKPVQKVERSSIEVIVLESSNKCPIRCATVNLFRLNSREEAQLESQIWPPPKAYRTDITDEQGKLVFDALPSGRYQLQYAHLPHTQAKSVSVASGRREQVVFELDFAVSIESMLLSNCGIRKVGLPAVGDTLLLKPHYNFDDNVKNQAVSTLTRQASAEGFPYGFQMSPEGEYTVEFQFFIPLIPNKSASRTNSAGQGNATSQPAGEGQLAIFSVFMKGNIMQNLERGKGEVGVTMGRTEAYDTSDVALWQAIKNSCENLSFGKYQTFIDSLISRNTSPQIVEKGQTRSEKATDKYDKEIKIRSVPFTNGEAYRLLKVATEAFVLVNCGVAPGQDLTDLNSQLNQYSKLRDLPSSANWVDMFKSQYLVADPIGAGAQPNMLPYLSLIRRKMPEIELAARGSNDLDNHLGYQLLQEKMAFPCMLELIWSYWHEEGMQVQTMNTITRRFQNVRSPHGNDPLANLETDPLRPLNNLLWGYTQDEQNRLTVVRRNYEYDHHYGLRLEGKAVQSFRPADSRSKFLEAFHHLLRMCSTFYKQDDDTTVKADAFPVLNALKEVHLILSQGAHNQYGDLPSTARAEMLMQQWMLARPEFRDFLPTRMMVAYPEPWMDRVDAMKKLQGWTDTSVLHFRSLGMFGEQVLLSVRFGSWSDIYEPAQAFNWARFWRPQVQGYIHAYRAVTGVDLTGTAVDAVVDATMPSVLLQRRLDQQQRSA